MRLDQLQLDLRPRTNAQALDLGFSLLRANAGRVYLVWLCLWLPLCFISAAISFSLFDAMEQSITYSFVIAWWLKPWLERAPLYMLSRQVFGEQVSVLDTLKAWPKQLGGGFWRLFFLRPFSAGRGLYHSIWQLEGARKGVARYRMRVIGRNTIGSATWFGVACAHFEGVIQVGVYALIGLFISDSEAINPFALFFQVDQNHWWPLMLCYFFAYTLAGSLIGPIYCACCFTLYLNRRATLEAWDLEIALRQMTAQIQTGNPKKPSSLHGIVATGLFVVMSMFGMQQDVKAQEGHQSFPKPRCEQGRLRVEPGQQRENQDDREALKTRAQVDQLYSTPDFQIFRCDQDWKPKEKKTKDDKPEEKKQDKANLEMIAIALKWLFIGIGVAAVIWILYRYGGQFFGFERAEQVQDATEVAGLDIRPESLPDDVASSALQLWAQGQRRAAIALLYRASIARLVEHHDLRINKGATEQDCLRLSAQILGGDGRHAATLRCFETCTEVWLKAAYGHQFPESITALCQEWRQQMDQGGAL